MTDVKLIDLLSLILRSAAPLHPAPRCVGRNGDQPRSYRYCRISFHFRLLPRGQAATVVGCVVNARNRIRPSSRSLTGKFPVTPFTCHYRSVSSAISDRKSTRLNSSHL